MPCPEDLSLPPADPPVAPWPWVVLLLALSLVAVYELWAVKTGRPTITQWLQRKSGGRWRWVRIIGGAVLVGVTVWHLLLGGPL